MRSNGYVVTYLWLRRIKRPHRREEREKGKAYKKWLRVEKQGRINDYSGHLSGGNDGENCREFEQVSASKKQKNKNKKQKKKQKQKQDRKHGSSVADGWAEAVLRKYSTTVLHTYRIHHTFKIQIQR